MQQPDAAAIRAPSRCVGGQSQLCFSAGEPARSPVSLSNATGMFEYSGQEMYNARPLFFCMLRYYFPEHFTLYTREGEKKERTNTLIYTLKRRAKESIIIRAG